MAYDEAVADRIRKLLASQQSLAERKMFGGLAFMVNGHMAVGVTADNLMVRVGPDAHADALAQPHARPMDFTGRPMKGFVFVDPPGYADDGSLSAWVDRGVRFVTSLQPK
jgi:hypothetical protein